MHHCAQKAIHMNWNKPIYLYFVKINDNMFKSISFIYFIVVMILWFLFHFNFSLFYFNISKVGFCMFRDDIFFYPKIILPSSSSVNDIINNYLDRKRVIAIDSLWNEWTLIEINFNSVFRMSIVSSGELFRTKWKLCGVFGSWLRPEMSQGCANGEL